MIKVEHIDVWGFEHAVRAARNPMNSWGKSDSKELSNGYEYDGFEVGENDLALMRRLYKSGVEHRTYARMIQVSMDITAPLYFWKEMDRYSIGKSQVSCSTMHKIHSREVTLDDFSHEHLIEPMEAVLIAVYSEINKCRKLYLETKDKKYWWQMIQLLPSSYNQRRTICMSYEVVFKIIKERTGHKLDEWNDFVKVLRSLPYIEVIVADDVEDESHKHNDAEAVKEFIECAKEQGFDVTLQTPLNMTLVMNVLKSMQRSCKVEA